MKKSRPGSRGTLRFATPARPRQAAVLLGLVTALVPRAFAEGGSASAASTVAMPPASSETWSLPATDLYGVAARGDRVWAVGYWGTILRSDDRGENWRSAPTPTDAELYDVAFGSDQAGWAVGARGALLRSMDGGRTWEALSTTIVDPFDGSSRPLDVNLLGVSAISENEAWAVGDFGVVLRTRNGKDWKQVLLPDDVFADENIPDRILNAVRFSDREKGWISGEFGTTLRTTDGGETWVGEREVRDAIEDIYLFDIAPEGQGWLLAGGVGGVALGSADGGETWTALDVPTTAGLFGVATRGDGGLLVGDRGVLLVSRDRGRNWREAERPRAFNWLRGVAFAEEGHAYAVGEDGLILRSTDGGDTWEWRAGPRPLAEVVGAKTD